ncbi:MAG: thiamine pyrophosphate-binding protein [Chloroflexi bacterium]|jgi:acetolactate synthase I/II/III large subunit|nr:thiamine pyrophosphate-binding protein [Chloroflexota bacterium]MBT5627886.1 thiamine pyrophosphate-binding protein [Chloroflexota bacterium]
MAKMTGAQFVAETIKSYGVDHIFFVPAVLYGVLAEFEKLGGTPVMAHSEKSAAYMADAYARVRNAPAVAFGQSVGAVNLAAGLQDAFLALSPVVTLTGRRQPGWRQRHSYQEVDHRAAYDAVTKFNAEVETQGELPMLLRQAFREAVSGAPAPTHLDLPGISGADLMGPFDDFEVISESRFNSIPPFRAHPAPDDIQAVAKLFAEAKRPAIVAGGGVTLSGAAIELRQLIEKLNVPMAYALNAKGQVPDNHPLNIGMVGSYSRSSANKFIRESDFVLYVGSRTGSQVTHDWKIPGPGVKVAQIDTEAAELGRNYPNAASVLGDARESLKMLIDAVDPVAERNDWLGRVGEIESDWAAEHEHFLTSDAVPMRPERVCKEISDALPDDGVVVVDTGHNAMWAGMYLDINKPGQRFLRCAGSLGWAFPAAIGAKYAVGDRPVVCFTGDGGLWYHFTELETAVSQNLPFVTVVNDNRSFNQTQGGVKRAFADNAGDGSNVWKFTDVDFAAVAQEMGAIGMRVTQPEELGSAIKEALEADRPVVIDAKTDPDAMAPLPWG